MNRNFISNSNFVLRQVLNSKENLDIIQDFIESFLDIEIQDIVLNPYLKKKERYLPSEDKFGIVDVRIKLNDLTELNVGIQWIDGYYIENKMLLYYSQIHSNQLEYDSNRDIVKTTTINILDFKYFNSQNYHQKKYIKDKQNNKLEFHVLELPKFNENFITNLDRKNAWMIYLCGDRKDLIDKIINKYEKINRLNQLLNDYWSKEKMQ